MSGGAGLQLIGAGFGRTGTLSLKSALETLGLDPCYHMLEVHRNEGASELWREAWRGQADWERLLGRYRATVDWPGCTFWRELAEAFPEAKVLLSLRDPERWYDSVEATIYRSMMEGMSEQAPEPIRKLMAMPRDIIFEGTFGGRMGERAHAIEVYERHNAEVRATIPPERLLVYEAAQGWEPLCAFLDVPVPDQPFPRVNTTEEFQARTHQVAQAGRKP